MTLLFSTVVLSLAWFAVANAAASLAILLLAAVRGTSIVPGARMLLVLRLMPFASGAILAAVLFAPAHVALEPRNPDERFGMVVYVAALVAIALLARSGWRVLLVLRGEWRLRAALADAVPVPASARAEAWEVSWIRGISLAGILRPRVLVGRAARLALTAAELDAAVAHELAHRRAHDNLKRFLMLCVPDLFGATPAATRLESAWRAEAECLADGVAAGGDQERAATLASALVKVARLADDRNPTCSPAWSTFYEPGILESRVRRLVASERPHQPRRRRSWPMLAGVAVATAGAWLGGVPATLHGLTELAIQLLP
jgi:hypothetical protein